MKSYTVREWLQSLKSDLLRSAALKEAKEDSLQIQVTHLANAIKLGLDTRSGFWKDKWSKAVRGELETLIEEDEDSLYSSEDTGISLNEGTSFNNSGIHPDQTKGRIVRHRRNRKKSLLL